MTDLDITIQLPQDLAERAQAAGLLNNKRIAQWLVTQLERIERWQAFDASLDPVREAFRAEYGDLTEDEIMKMITEEVLETRSDLDATFPTKPLSSIFEIEPISIGPWPEGLKLISREELYDDDDII